METRKVECDHCKCDLTETKGVDDYSLRLVLRTIPNTGAIHIDVLVRPPIVRNMDFCGLGCLKKWLEEGK